MTVIPEGAAPGMTLIIDVPDTDPATNLVGSLKMQMQVPEGAKPGMMYKLKIQRSQARYQQSLVQQQQQQLQQQAAAAAQTGAVAQPQAVATQAVCALVIAGGCTRAASSRAKWRRSPRPRYCGCRWKSWCCRCF